MPAPLNFAPQATNLPVSYLRQNVRSLILSGQRDQFAPELLYFSECILQNRDPEPTGLEGLIDVRVIEALHHSAKTSKPIKLRKVEKRKRPSLQQQIRQASVREPNLIHAKSASHD